MGYNSRKLKRVYNQGHDIRGRAPGLYTDRDVTHIGTIRLGGYDVVPPDYCTEINTPDGSSHNTPYCQPCEGNWNAGRAEQWCGPSNSCAEVVWCKSDWEILTYSEDMLSSIRHCCEYKFGLTYTDYEVVAIPGTEECMGPYYGTGNEWRHPMFECYADLSNFISGCMDEDACNYDPTAQFDDGSCYYGDCINDWYMQGYEETSGDNPVQAHLLSMPMWIDSDDSNGNLTYDDVFGPLCEDGLFTGIIGEGVAMSCYSGQTAGSLKDNPIDPFDGFWIMHPENPGSWEPGPFNGTVAWDNNTEIPLNFAANLLSFPVYTESDYQVPIGMAIPNTNNIILGIIGQGGAALWVPEILGEIEPGTGGGSVYDMCEGQVDDTWPQTTECVNGCYGEGGEFGLPNECGCESTCNNSNEMGDDYNCDLDITYSFPGISQTFYFINHTQLRIYPEWAGEESSGPCVPITCQDTIFIQSVANGEVCGSRCGDPNNLYLDSMCRYDVDVPGWLGQVRIFLKRASDGQIYEIFNNPSSPDYLEPFVMSGAALQWDSVDGPAIAIPSVMSNPGYWVGSLSELEFGKGYWIMANNGVENFNWMGFGSDPRGAEADFHKVNLNMPPLDHDTNIDDYIDMLCEQHGHLSVCNTPGLKVSQFFNDSDPPPDDPANTVGGKPTK